MVRLTALIALASLAAASTPVAARCARMNQQPVVFTAETVVTADGGIVVGTREVQWDQKDKGEAVQKSWRLRAGGRVLTPSIDVIAPGLAVYRLPAKLAAAVLVDGKKVVAKVKLADKLATIDAPKVVSIVHTQRMGRRSSVDVVVNLDGTAPPGVVALVLVDATGKARSWGEAMYHEERIPVFNQSSCGVLPNGTVASVPGDEVTLFWVDMAGRVSPPSKPVVITGAPATGGP